MKKLWTFLFLTVLLSVSIFAQTVTIGTGTTTASGVNGSPIYRSSTSSSFHHSKSIQLLAASQLSAAGLAGGEQITGWAYNKQNNGAPSGANAWTLNVYLKNSTATTLATGTSWTTMISGAVLGYTATITSANMPSALGYWNWPITGFTYTGGAIECYIEWFPAGTMTSPYTTNSFLWQYTASGNQAMGTSSGAAIAGTNASWTTQARFYNTQITYTAGFACSGTPAPGNTVSSVTSACPSVNFNLSLQNPTLGSGVSYQWYSSPNNSTWSPITGATSAGYTANQTSATWYKCDVTCSGITGTSTPVQVNLNPFYNCYCPSAAGSSGDEEITNVTFGSSLNNTTTCASLVGTQGTATGTADLYSDFRGITPTQVNLGSTASISVEVTECAGSPYSHMAKVYIDFNHNGLLTDAGEEFIIYPYASSNTHTISSNITIPPTALIGNTLMRVIVKETSAFGPCDVSSWGETEDYLVNIVSPTTPFLAALPSNLIFGYTASGNTSVEQSYSLSGDILSAGPVVVTAPAGFEVSLTTGTGFAGTINVPYTPPTLAATTIFVRFKPTGAPADYTGNITNVGGGATKNVAVTGSSILTYCTSVAGFTADEEIFNVTIGGLNNTSDCSTTAPGPGSILQRYSNYTTSVPPVTYDLGSTYTVSILVGTCGGNYGSGTKVFIDYNQDGDFTDAGEEAFATTVSTSGPHTVSGSLTISATALTGLTRMRVINWETSIMADIVGCGNPGYGETEDYLINIVPLTNMAYVSSTTTTPTTAPVIQNTNNNVIAGIKIVTYGSLSPLSLTSLFLSTAGSTNPATDITKAKIWTSGLNAIPTTVVLLDSVLNPVGDFAINFATPYTLLAGDNYFWLTYDVPLTATAFNILDAQCDSMQISTVKYYPSVTTPAGNRVIKAPLIGTYTIDNTLPTAGTNYANFTDAALDLNVLGIGGPVTFNVTAGQTFPMTVGATPANFAFNIQTQATAAWPVVFQKFGTGVNPLIFITGTSATNDVGVWLNTADYITFNGIDVTDAGSTAADYLDVAYYYQGTATNGCNNNTLKNATVNLNKSNASAKGVFINSQATAISGRNNYNKFYNNTIAKVSYGYQFLGKFGLFDVMNEIGTDGTGRSKISGVGSTAANIARGIDIGYQDSIQIFNTLIENISSTYSGFPYPGLCGIAMTNSMSNFNIYGDTLSQLNGSVDPVGINFYSSAGVNNLHHCVFTDFTATAGNINVLRNEGQSMGTFYIYNNVLTRMNNSAGEIEGLYMNGPGTYKVYNNKIYGFNNTSVGTQGLDGMFIANSANNSTIYNNMIYDLKAPSSTGTPSVRALRVSGAGNLELFNNTIYLNYTSLVATNQSACIYVPTVPTSLDMRNNIVINKTDVTTGLRAAAFWWGSSLYTNISVNTNNNLYYVGVYPNSTIFYNGTTAYPTLAQYKVALGSKDQGAKTEDVPFISGVSPFDLNIQTAVETQAESGASVIATIVSDINGTPRYPNTGYPDNTLKPAVAPDLGAIEFGGLAKDLTPPAISFTDLTITSDLLTRTFTANITDQGAVNGMPSFKPRVYYKKLTHANNFADNTNATDGWKYVEATNSSSPYSFTMDYNLLYSMPVVGDVLQYFVVAQDVEPTPNFGAYVANFAVQPANVQLAAANFPVTGAIKQFNFANAINGVILVGAGNPFNCLTCQGDTSVFKYINNNVVTGNIELKITSNLEETGFTALNQFVEEGAGNYTLSIMPNAATVDTIRGTYFGGLIRLNGTDRVTIDGRFDGNGRYLTFANLATSGSVFQLISLGNALGATNNTITNCDMYMGSNGGGTYGISIGGTSVGTSGSNNHNNTIYKNNISKVYVGIFASGNDVPGLMDNLNIEGNIIGNDSAAMYLGHDGIMVSYTMGTNLTGNKIFNVINGNTTSRGISLLSGVRNTNVNKNVIDNMRYTGTSGYASHGLYVSTGLTASNINITNNVISRMGGDGWNAFSNSSPVGIYLDGVTGGINIYYNTVNLIGTLTNGQATVSTAMLLNSATITNVNMKNNIFSNTMRNTVNSLAKNYAIYSLSPAAAFTSINNNLYYVNDTSIQSRIGYLVADKPLLADWQAASTQDANSIAANPQFTSDEDVTPLMSSPALSAGAPIVGVTTDITGKSRASFTPTIGAYEVDALKSLNLTLFLEGLYNGVNMNEAYDENGIHWGVGIADKINVELHNATTPSIVEATFTNQELSTAGLCTVSVPATMSDAYYIVIKHRNSITTWSALPFSFAGVTINYNFTTAANMAYGDNLKNLGSSGFYGILVGDVNADGLVDGSDMSDTETANNNFDFGYIVTDVNGDGLIDGSDMSIVETANNNFVAEIMP